MSFSKRPTISVIIPALNEAAVITQCVASTISADTHEVIVVDGGSCDKTRELAASAGATVVSSQVGRANQMNTGAKEAVGDVLLFLHGDCTMSVGAMGRLRDKLASSEFQVGYFKQRIAGKHWMLRLTEVGSCLRAKWLHRPYGDQAMFFTRSAFDAIGGFPVVPIMEDLLIARAARRFRPFLAMPDQVISSARRWHQDGIWRRTFRNWSVAIGERRGVPLDQLCRQYYGGADENDNPQGVEISIDVSVPD